MSLPSNKVSAKSNRQAEIGEFSQSGVPPHILHNRGVNPMFMKYVADADGYFVGQGGYGYRSIEAFVQAVAEVQTQLAGVHSFEHALATVQSTVVVTAVLEAGRRSLDENGRAVAIQYDGSGQVTRVAGIRRAKPDVS